MHPAVQLGGKTGYAMTDQVKAISTQRFEKPHRNTLADDDVARIRFALRRMLDLT